jgi:tRNA threonylcarbamoyladenosine biosynthesis protein TsaE
MKFPLSIESDSEDATSGLALSFAKELKPGDIVAMNGNLGSGKTFFIKKVTEYFGIKYASSPSFAIVNEYNGDIKIYHFDFFRLNKIEELYDIGWYDYLNNNDSIIFIEWGELLKEVLPERRFEIRIIMLDESERRFEFEKYE